jgi:cyclopropane-fatty-acyl-phospholipid synthase
MALTTASASTSTNPDFSGLPYSFRLVAAVAARIRYGSIAVKVPDGRRFVFSGQEPGKHGELEIKDFNVLTRLYRSGNVGFAEGYLAGEWDSPDVAALLESVARNTDRMLDFFSGKPLARLLNRLIHLLNRNSKSGSKRNIMAHYDLGNAFYRRWLDSSMTYSSALYSRPGQDLAEAQHNKYRALAERMHLGPNDHVLEIGCGWGGFAEFAAKEVGARVTGITISPEQYDFARKRLFEQGLADKTEIRLQDYRDTTGHYDRVASIEMFEAVGEQYWPAYFQKVRDVLKPGGQAGLQIITISDSYFDVYRRGVDFIQKYVFPGGMLPSPSALRQQVSRAGLSWAGEDRFGGDYAETLADWRGRFTAAWDDIRGLGFDERFRRLWTYYLSYCEAGFRAGSIDVTQIALKKA